jgi:hypothetical protein
MLRMLNEIQGNATSDSVQCDNLSKNSLYLYVQEMNGTASWVCEITKNTFRKYVYSFGVYLSTVATLYSIQMVFTATPN